MWYHQMAEMKAKAASLGLPVVSYDGCTEIYVHELEDWIAFMNSPVYKQVIGSNTFPIGAFNWASYW